MSRQIEEPTVTETGEETHPAFGLIGASRVSSSPPGATLFDSDIRHQHSILLRIRTAVRKRNLNHDYIYGEQQLVEVELSEAQWASFVSSLNSGDGVPCTIRHRESVRDIPGLPYAPRMAESLREIHEATEKTFGKISEALAAYEEKKTAANLRSLRAAIQNAGSNLDFTAQSMANHAEGVVQRARADIEAFVVNKAAQLGLEPGAVLSPPELTGEVVDVDTREGE